MLRIDRSITIVLGVGIAIAGCDNESDGSGSKSQRAFTVPSTTQSAGNQAQADKCDARVVALKQRFDEVEPNDLLVDDQSDLDSRLPASAHARKMEVRGPTVSVDLGRLTFAFEPVGNMKALRKRAQEEAKLFESTRASMPDADMPMVVYVLTNADTPASEMRDLVAAMPTAYQTRLIVRQKNAPVPYRPADGAPGRVLAFWAQILDPANGGGAKVIVDTLEQATGMCGPLIQTFAAVSGKVGKEHTDALRKGVPSAVGQCKCGKGVDMELLEQALLAGWKVHMPRQRWIPLHLDARAATRITLPGTASVAAYVAAYDALSEAERAGPIKLQLQ